MTGPDVLVAVSVIPGRAYGMDGASEFATTKIEAD